MTIEFSLPDIGEGLEEAEVIEWHVKPGDTVARDQPFVDILTDKAQTEMPAPSAGVVVSLGAEVGDVVKVGDVLIVIDDGGAGAGAGGADEPNGAEDSAASPSITPQAPQPPAPPRASAATTPISGRRPKASPSTRKRAAELGIDLATIAGTGPGGRILATDLEQPAAVVRATDRPATGIGGIGPAVAAGPAPALGQMPIGTHPLRGIRRATAKAMDLSWSTIPHVTAMDELDATELLLARSRAKDALGETGGVITPLALLLVGVARSLRRFPMMNATLDLPGEEITVHEDINLGVAVATDRGLMVPIVRNADRLGVLAMATEVARLSTEARAGSISSTDLADGTFTVTNYGSNGGYFAAPIIRPGEAGIVGFGAITKRPIVIDDQVEARPVIPIVLSADHRLIDGDVLSAFQADLSSSIAKAITLLVG